MTGRRYMDKSTRLNGRISERPISCRYYCIFSEAAKTRDSFLETFFFSLFFALFHITATITKLIVTATVVIEIREDI